jgi:hypothetical protein
LIRSEQSPGRYRVQLHLANETVRVFTRRFPDFMADAFLVGSCQYEGLLFQFFRQCRKCVYTKCLLFPRPNSDVIGDDGTLKRVTSGSAIKFTLQSIVVLLGFTADYSAIVPPPLFCCEPHGFRAVAPAVVHPALYQSLFPCALVMEKTRGVPLNLRLPSEVLLDW